MNSYKTYLGSKDWREKREAKLWRRGGTRRRCAICGSRRHLIVHHLTYRNLVDVMPSDLRLLCNECHKVAHELLKAGKVRLDSNKSHHSWFQLTRNAVRKARKLPAFHKVIAVEAAAREEYWRACEINEGLDAEMDALIGRA